MPGLRSLGASPSLIVKPSLAFLSCPRQFYRLPHAGGSWHVQPVMPFWKLAAEGLALDVAPLSGPLLGPCSGPIRAACVSPGALGTRTGMGTPALSLLVKERGIPLKHTFPEKHRPNIRCHLHMFALTLLKCPVHSDFMTETIQI